MMEALRMAARRVARAVAPNMIQRRHIAYARRDEQEIDLLPLIAPAGRLAVDVGANIGLYVAELLAIGARVVAFEPNPRVADRLAALFGRRIRLERVALSTAPGSAELRMPKGLTPWATIESANRLELADTAQGFDSYTVPVCTLDGFGLTDVGFLKVDVEGHEEGVLAGATAMLAREQPNVLVELEERHNPGCIERVRQLMADLGYRGFLVKGHRVEPIETGFDALRDQRIENVGIQGKRAGYHNNFLFFPAARADDLRAALEARLGG